MTPFRSKLLAQVKGKLVKELLCELRAMKETDSIDNLEFFKGRAYEVVGFGATHGIFDTKDFLFWHEEINGVFDDRSQSFSLSENNNG